MQLPFSKPPEAWNEEDLLMLCRERVPETQRMDYKRELKLDPPRERRELLKDITALANSMGGVIIYGIAEVKHNDLGSVASELCALDDASLVDKANRIIRSHISPAIEYYLHTIPASASGFYLIAHVPQSLHRPHAIEWESKLDYYVRRNQDNFPMTETEVRELYRQATNFSLSLKQRYQELDADTPRFRFWKVVSMPIIPEMELLDTLTVTGESLTTGEYARMFGGSNSLQSKVTYFEETREGNETVLATRLYRGGEFMISQEFLASLNQQSIAGADLYKRWFGALRYFGKLYATYGYYGPLRISLETSRLNHEQIHVLFAMGDGYRASKFEREHVLIWVDSKVEDLVDPTHVANSLLRYFAQGCGTDLSQQQLSRYRNLA